MADDQLAEPATEELSENPWTDEPSPEPEAPAEQEAEASDTTTDVVDPPAEEPEQEKTVPYGALHEERMLRKEAAKEAAEAREKMIRMEERFQAIQERMNPPEPETTFDDDPAEYLQAQNQALAADVEQLKQIKQQEYQQQQQTQNFNNMMSTYRESVDAYSKTAPDFQEAYGAVFNGRVAEYQAAGYNEADATKFSQQDEVSIVQKAFQDGVNPGERIMALAKARGWEKGAGKSQGGSEKLETIKAGQEAAKTLGGGTPETAPTLEALADMNDADFEANWDKVMGTKNTSIYG